MQTGNTVVARAYIRYRFQHEILRNQENAKSDSINYLPNTVG